MAADTDRNHIPQERILEFVKNTALDFSKEEWSHLPNCDICKDRFLALLKEQREKGAASGAV